MSETTGQDVRIQPLCWWREWESQTGTEGLGEERDNAHSPLSPASRVFFFFPLELNYFFIKIFTVFHTIESIWITTGEWDNPINSSLKWTVIKKIRELSHVPATLPPSPRHLSCLILGKAFREYLVTLSDNHSCTCQVLFDICMSVLILSKHTTTQLCIKNNT